MTVDIIKEATGKQPGASFLLDGFPKTVGALALLEEQLAPCRTAIVFEAEDAFMEQASGKAGDELAPVKRQIRTYKNQTLPLVVELEGRGKVKKVDASDSDEAVFEAARAAYTSR